MLLSLSIRNFVIVEALDLDFAPGFTVLSGETGAGKSILIDALLLALGERGDADVVREGAQRAEISAEFRPGEHVQRWLAQNDLASDDGALIARRTIDAAGRSKSFINGSAVTLTQLRELGESLIDVHGQHAHQSLLRPASQLQLLDEHGGLTLPGHAVAEAFAVWKSAQRAREDAETMAASAMAEQERLRWIVDELDVLAPQPREWEEVSTEHKRLSHAAGLLEGARAAIDTLSDADTSALSQVAAVHARLTQLAPYDERIAPIVELLDAAQIQLDEAVSALTRYLDKTDLDASRLADVDARLSALHAAARKFKAAPEALAETWQSAKNKLQALSAAGDLDALRAREASARDAYDKAAQELSKKRAKAAKQMSTEVTRAMQDLSMAGGRFDAAANRRRAHEPRNRQGRVPGRRPRRRQPEAARSRCIRRRARAHQPGDLGDRRQRNAGCHADLRRGRRRDRRRSRRYRRPTVKATRPEPPGARGHASAASRRARRSALSRHQGGQRRRPAGVTHDSA